MKYLVDAYVADPASGGNVLKTLTVEADDMYFDHGAAVFMRKVTKPAPEPVGGFAGPSRHRTVFVRAFAPEIWTQIRPEPEIARTPKPDA